MVEFTLPKNSKIKTGNLESVGVMREQDSRD